MADPFVYTAPDGTLYDMEPVTVDENWFNDGVDNGTAPVNSDQYLNVAESEIGEDNQFSSYDLFMVGQPSVDARKPGRTVEWNMAAHDQTAQDTVHRNQEFRVIGKKRHNHDGTVVADYGTHRKLNETTPSEQVGVPRRAMRPIRSGDDVVLQSRDPNGERGVNRAESSFEIHGYVGSRR